MMITRLHNRAELGENIEMIMFGLNALR